MKTSNVNGPGERSHAIVRGHTGLRAGSTGIAFEDVAGNVVRRAPRAKLIGASVSGRNGVEAVIQLNGTGQETTNNSGDEVIYGGVVVLDTDGSVITTTTPQDTRPVGVVQLGGPDGEPVNVVFQGYVAQVNTNGSVNAGDYLETSATPGLAQAYSDRRAGSFALALGDGPNPPALLSGATDTTGVLPSPSGDPDDAIRGDLTWRPVQTPAFYSGTLSKPPTESELEVILGDPSGKGGQIYPIGDTGSGTVRYGAFSDGDLWCLIPLIRPVDDTGSPPAGFAVYGLTSAPEGGWSWFEDPRAVAHGSYTYIGYVDSSGNLKIAIVTGGAVVATRTLHAALEVDDHDPPTLHVRASDGKLITFYSKHNGANIYKRISTTSLDTDPTLVSGFASEVSLSAGLSAASSTYPSPTYLSNVDGSGARLLLGWREFYSGTNEFWYAASTDDGDTIGGRTRLHTQTYSKTAPNGTGRWDLACSNHGSVATKIYHIYRESGAWHQSDGTTISTSLPMAGSDMTTVYDGGTDHVWISDIAIDGSNNPVIVFMTWPANDYTDTRYMYAVWTGSAWDVNEVTDGGGWLPSSVEYPPGTFQYQYSGGVILDHDDPQIVYCSREVSAGVFEVFRYVTDDGGSSFAETQITDDGVKSFRPISVRDASDITVAWLYGSYTNYVSWSTGIKGLVP